MVYSRQNDKQYCVRELIKAKKVASVILRKKLKLKFHAMAYEFGYSKPQVANLIYKKASTDKEILKEVNNIMELLN